MIYRYFPALFPNMAKSGGHAIILRRDSFQRNNKKRSYISLHLWRSHHNLRAPDGRQLPTQVLLEALVISNFEKTVLSLLFGICINPMLSNMTSKILPRNIHPNGNPDASACLEIACSSASSTALLFGCNIYHKAGRFVLDRAE